MDFGLQKRTGPSSGVVASIVLVSPGLDCPGVSLAEDLSEVSLVVIRINHFSKIRIVVVLKNIKNLNFVIYNFYIIGKLLCYSLNSAQKLFFHCIAELFYFL